MTKPINPVLVSFLSLVCLTLACAQTSNAVTSVPAASMSPSATNSASNPTEVIPVPTITFAEHHNSGWSHIPTVVIVGKQGDARFSAIEEAIQWWNGQLQSIGTPFHFGKVTENYSFDADQLVPAKLRTADPSDPGNPVTGNIPKNAAALGGDIIIALTSYDLTSRNMVELKGITIDRDVILIKDFAKAGTPLGNSSPGAPKHELGHAIGLMHDSSTNSIMCGPPWNDQIGCLNRKGQFLLDQDKDYILSLYPEIVDAVAVMRERKPLDVPINQIGNQIGKEKKDKGINQAKYQEVFMTERSSIYRHVVLFQFNDATPQAKLELIEGAFRDLCAGLPFVKDFEWGRNSSPEKLNGGFTHCFIVTFADENGRDLYLPHPDHQAFCREFLDPNLKKVCVIDFQSND